MDDLNDKVTGGTLSAAEWNQLPSEAQSVIEALGLVLSGADLNQLGKAIAGYAGAATWYADSGIADAYVLSAVGGKQGTSSLDVNHDGLLIRFVPGNDSTGASTINVNNLGVKDIKREDGGPLLAADLSTGRDAWIRWSFSADDFILQTFNIPGTTDVPRGFIDGFVLSNAADTANDITFGTGIARSFADTETMLGSSATTKQIDVDWVAGTNQGGFPSGLTLTDDTWYHAFVIKDTSTGTVDFGFDSSLTATNLLADASAYSEYRRVGAIYYNVSTKSGIRQFIQIADRFNWIEGDNDIDLANPGTGEVSHTLVSIPLGVKVLVVGTYTFSRFDNATATQYKVGPGGETLASPGVANNNCRTEGNISASATCSPIELSNTSQQVKTRCTSSNANMLVDIHVAGWIDPRGKDA